MAHEIPTSKRSRFAVGGLEMIGALLHLVLLFAPVLATGQFFRAAQDRAILAFAALITLFYFAEIRGRCPRDSTRRNSVRQQWNHCDRMSNRLAALSCVLILALFWQMLAARTSINHDLNYSTFLVACTMMAIGACLRHLAIRTLNDAFVTEATPVPCRPLITDGIYRWLAHPSETGLLCVVSGAAILLESPTAALAAMVTVVPLMVFRIRLEEQALLAAHGLDYSRYQKRVRRFLPMPV